MQLRTMKQTMKIILIFFTHLKRIASIELRPGDEAEQLLLFS